MNPLAERLRKAAVLVATLDADEADAVLERLPPEHAALVRRTLVELSAVDAGEEAAIIGEFIGRRLPDDSNDPDAVTLELSGRVEAVPSASDAATQSFNFLHEADVEDLVELLADERPQTVAVVVSHLPSSHAARTLSALPEALQVEVVRRLATLDETDPVVLREVEAGMERRFHRRFALGGRRMVGVAAVRQILQEASPDHRRHWLTNLTHNDPRLAARLTQSSIRYADLGRMSDESWRTLLNELDEATVVAALAGSEPEFAADVLRRLARADAQRLQRSIDGLGPTRLSDLDAAQDEMVRTARDLEMQGRLEWQRTETHAESSARESRLAA